MVLCIMGSHMFIEGYMLACIKQKENGIWIYKRSDF